MIAELTEERRAELDESIKAWRDLAAAELHAIELGIHDRFNTASIARERAALYERTAHSLEIQRDTGVAVCVCCLKPY